MGVFSYGKKISKVIDIKEAALNADSQIVDTLKFQSILVPHSRTFTFIPKYIKYFNSYENMNNRPYFYDQYWPIFKKEKVLLGFSSKSRRKKGSAANEQYRQRKILDIFNVRRQHRTKQKVDPKIMQYTP